MAKASAPGRTKTRLVPPLTFEEAASFNPAFLPDIAAKLLRAGREAPIKPFMAFGPSGSEPFFHAILPPGVGLIESWLPDFGRCLSHAITAMLDAGLSGACVLNADSPTLPMAYLVEAARRLAEPGDRMVFGPSTDGGYYLLGVKHLHARLFEDITWSTEVVAAQTLERAREIGLPVHVLPTWYDVDDRDTLSRVVSDLAGRDGPADHDVRPDPAPATAALLLQLDRTAGLAGRLGIEMPDGLSRADWATSGATA